jgi:3-oxoacyl-[acyl-carrier-protein] synthase II
MSERRIVITGTGTVNPLGHNVADTWLKASTGASGITAITRFDASQLTARVAGEVKGFDYTAWFEGDHLKTAKRMDPFVHFAEAALQEAIASSGIDIASGPDRIGICIGSGMGGVEAQHANSAALATKGPRRVSPFYVPAAIGNIASGFLSIIHSIEGPNLSVQTACATANHALISSYLIIKHGLADAMFAGGSEAAVTELGVAGFCNMRALATNFNDEPERASRPYDASRDGFVIAEGAGVFVLEELEYAKRRGANILCELKSVGMSGDGYDLVIPEPEGKGAERSMRMAMETGGIDLADLHYINTHGTATPLGDVAESKAVYRLLGGVEDHVHVSSTKSMHGHLLGAAGAIEGIICIEAIRNGIVPPSINIEQLDPDVPLHCINTTPIEKTIKVAISNSFGFGGHNSSVAFAAF